MVLAASGCNHRIQCMKFILIQLQRQNTISKYDVFDESESQKFKLNVWHYGTVFSSEYNEYF